MLFSVVFILSHFLAIATGFFVFVNIKQNPPCCSPDICKIVIQDQITGIERDSTQFRAHQLFTNKKRKLQFNRVSHFRYERRRRDSNPRAPEGKRISSAPRYDHFDTSPILYKVVEITPFICAVHSFFIIPEFSSKENPLFILFRQSNTYRACTDQYQ